MVDQRKPIAVIVPKVSMPMRYSMGEGTLILVRVVPLTTSYAHAWLHWMLLWCQLSSCSLNIRKRLAAVGLLQGRMSLPASSSAKNCCC